MRLVFERDALRKQIASSDAVVEAAREWLDSVDSRGGRFLDGIPGELMDSIDAHDLSHGLTREALVRNNRQDLYALRVRDVTVRAVMDEADRLELDETDALRMLVIELNATIVQLRASLAQAHAGLDQMPPRKARE